MFREKNTIDKAYQIKDIDIEKTEYEDIDTSVVSLEYQHAIHVDGARTVMVRTVRFYEPDTDLWHVVTETGDTANDNASPPLRHRISRKRSYLSSPKVHIPIVQRHARACVSFEGWKARVTANTSAAVHGTR